MVKHDLISMTCDWYFYLRYLILVFGLSFLGYWFFFVFVSFYFPERWARLVSCRILTCQKMEMNWKALCVYGKLTLGLVNGQMVHNEALAFVMINTTE